MMSVSWAEAIVQRQANAIAAVGRLVLRLRPDNLVERPWGGRRILEYKGLPEDPGSTDSFGEAFEISAAPSDAESRAHPSVVCFPDGSEALLPDLLQAAGREILGEAVHGEFGGEFPLLPKILDIRELLSVQAHPEGNAEVYVVIDAQSGATIRLGFRRDASSRRLLRFFLRAVARRDALRERMQTGAQDEEIQATLAPYFSNPAASVDDAAARLGPLLRPDASRREVIGRLDELKRDFWEVLDLLNEIPLAPGQVLYNATPARLRGAGLPSAEVHALGNPARREILLLEIRFPGPTWRAWDNLRFPQRELHLREALRTINLSATRPEEFVASAEPVPGVRGLFRSVEHPFFRVEHLRPGLAGGSILEEGGVLRSLHTIRGEAVVRPVPSARDASSPSEETVARSSVLLRRGASALLPPGIPAFAVEADDPATEVVQVTIEIAPRWSG